MSKLTLRKSCSLRVTRIIEIPYYSLIHSFKPARLKQLTWRRRQVPRRRGPRMYQMRMVQTATERHRLGITVTSHLGHRRHRELIVVLLTVCPATSTRATAAASTSTGTTQITVMVVVMRGGLVFPWGRNRFGLNLHRQGRSRRRRCTIRYGQMRQAAAEKDSE